MQQKKFGLAIVGGSGYGAGELLRLALLHPHIEVFCVTSRAHGGKPVTSIHSHLHGLTPLVFSEALDTAALARYERAAIVLAMPSGQAIPAIQKLLRDGIPEGTVVMDLSGDLRLTDPDTHATHYRDVPFEADIRARFTYGLSELQRERIAASSFITNPGCLATAAILALAPLATSSAHGTVVVDAKTGTSGAGREPQASMHHPMRSADFTAYKVLEHRHEPEIVQALGAQFSQNHSFMFVPHLIPTSRGIFVTAYVTLPTAALAAELKQRYATFYDGEPFIRLRATPPRLVDVVGTNFCDISVVARGNQLVVMSAIDNLGKGMASQAIQNLNITFGLPQSTGLLVPALGPV